MNRQRRFITFILLAVSLLIFKQAASAQTAQVTGTVTDPRSAVIAGAQVTLTNVDTGVARKAATNGDGYYSIPFVPPGNYRFDVLAPNYPLDGHDLLPICNGDRAPYERKLFWRHARQNAHLRMRRTYRSRIEEAAELYRR
ncbi:MAG: carboxypeptidase-like regulatory domain-containing protein [bacterium]